ncbi:hypothetical protein QBC32DRAFT_207797 [Pseudoneurospora amorphoporcata]|uniref:Uncharacterized protein n=1 Tax=Pseudoneurospora amorphoporcata TaxID=241081 RepID=A0AAN6P0Q2_9PEZI|nr:hypothetical protein QBC32DRAFT_207797 [Pseudoneurospora amorphoporcata]
MAASAGNTSYTDAAITVASPALHAGTPTPAASTPNTSKPLPPRPRATTTAAAITRKTNITLPSALKIKTKPGASIYSKPLMLTTYDKYVLGFSMTYLWRCPSSTILVPFFRQNFRAEKHLDIGVGTGFFVGDALAERLAKDEDFMTLERDPDRKLVQPKIDITLMDLNGKALETARMRVMGVVNHSRFKGESGNMKGKNGKDSKTGPKANVAISVTTIQADVLDAPDSGFSAPGGPSISRHSFKSVSMFNLLHCLPCPGPEPQGCHVHHGQAIKNRAFRLAAECLADDGVLAGCTILGRKYISGGSWSRPSSSSWGSGAGVSNIKGKGAVHGRTSDSRTSVWRRGMTWSVMKWYNATGVFGNWADEREEFEKGLRENFDFVETHVVGCMLLFNAARPKRGVE